MKNKKTAEIDFDTWSEMARSDPETFELMRQVAIEAAIEGASESNRQRLRCLQWRIDQERRLARTPMAACLRISRMMWRTVLGPGGLNDRFGELQGLFSDRPGGLPAAPPSEGRVVAFARTRD
ncbi:MAG: DUF3135 domain-containing protein [Gammaproteobacteria bacterium]|jgi:hypothetical protein|nr:DUF3135 domain-containing protein [Gammaproteobacteria bacterium]